MNGIPVANKYRTTYENFIAKCPHCAKENIFNRASDLCSFEPISGRDVTCQHIDCERAFRIVGDSINSAFEMLIFDCYELAARKQYMACILNLAQAHEMFFGLFLRVELLYRPFHANPDQDLDALEQLSRDLYRKIKNYTFAPMRALFLHRILAGNSPKDLVGSQAIITNLPLRPREPKDAALENLGDAELVPLLKKLKASTIHELRNKVIHKRAYRPVRDEVEAALAETRSILFPLAAYLKLYDDINFYRQR